MGKRILVWLILLLPLAWESFDAAETAAVSGSAQLTQETYYIALTFDDGPRRETTERLLDGLRERGASATFFLIGRQIPGNEDLVRRMEAEGHQVGNHTWNHVTLSGDLTGDLEELRRTDALLQEILGPGTYWIRPPYGLISEAERAAVQVPLAHWTVDPEDWAKLSPEAVVQAVMKDAGPNDIVLLHDFFSDSVDAALEIVDLLQAKGYCFVTVEELLALHGVTPQPGVMYREIPE